MKKAELIKKLKNAEKNFYNYKSYIKVIEYNRRLYIDLTLIELICKANNRTKSETKKQIDLLIKFINEQILKTKSIDLLELNNYLYYLKGNL